MKLYIVSSLILVVGCGAAYASDDNFAAVSGTGWTDITQLQSTCSVPGYFVNPSDCNRFYVCVDHSTAEKNLLLRYDFNCPAGLAFDESTKNCNYPGPSGCVENGGTGGWGSGGGGWNPTPSSPPSGGSGGNGGWNPPSGGSGSNGGWNPPSGGNGGWSPPPSGGWNSQGGNSGWSRNPGIFQSTSTVTKYPAWGAAQNSIGTVSKQTIVRGPTVLSSGGGAAIFRVVSSTPSPLPSNPRINLPTATIVHIPATQWESQRIQPVQRVIQSGGSGWSQSTKVVGSGAVFQSARVTPTATPTTVAWGSARIIPVDTATVYQSARVTPVPQAQWEIPQSFPIPQTTVIEQPRGGWGQTIRVSSPSPAPAPANPSSSSGGIIYATVRPITVTQVPPTPSSAFQATRVTQTSQGSTGVVLQQTSAPEWQGVRVTSQQRPATLTGPSPANPSLQSISTSSGWEGAGYRFTQLPSGFIWQTTNTDGGKPTQQEQQSVFVSSRGPSPTPQPVQSGNFGIVQQVINEQQNEGSSGEAQKSHIQVIYETKEKQQSIQSQGGQTQSLQGQFKQISFQGGNNQLGTGVTQVQSQRPGSPNPGYEIIATPDSSLPKGRIIVLYSPISRGNKREAEVPIVEVEVEERDVEGDDASK